MGRLSSRDFTIGSGEIRQVVVLGTLLLKLNRFAWERAREWVQDSSAKLKDGILAMDFIDLALLK